MSNLPHPFVAPDYTGMIFMAEYSMCAQATHVWIAKREIESPCDYVTRVAKLDWETIKEPHSSMPEPTIVCRDRPNDRDGNQLQYLFNALWDLGFRPPKHDPSGEVIAAKDQNLKDLRTILFNTLEIPSES